MNGSLAISRDYGDEDSRRALLVEELSKIRPWKFFDILLDELDLSKDSDLLFGYFTHCVLSVKAADVMDEGR